MTNNKASNEQDNNQSVVSNQLLVLLGMNDLTMFFLVRTRLYT